ncbi:MAG: Gfo/Idh/MocA family protein [Anaerolineae bacterium]
MKLRVGVVGLGMGKYHAKAYDASEKAELVAICDVKAELLAEYQRIYPHAAAYTGYEDMFIRGGLDAVSVAVPNALHAEVSIAAMQAGLHVLCEKPMALNAAQAQEMLDVSRETGKKLMIHFNYRFSPPSQFLKSYVDEGNLGSIYYAKTRWLRSRGIPKLGGWFGIKGLSGGGPLIDLGVHRLDLAMWLMGYPKALSVSASTYGMLGARLAQEAGATYDVEDLASAFIRLNNGVTLTLEASWAGGTERAEDMLTAIYGTEGAAIQRNRGEGYEFEAVVLQDVAGAMTEVSPRRYTRQCPSAIDEFVDAIREDRVPSAPGEQGLEMMRIIDAIYQSAEEGHEIRLA